MRTSTSLAVLALLVACASSQPSGDRVAGEARSLDTPVAYHPDEALREPTAEVATYTLGEALARELALAPVDPATPFLGRADVEILAPWFDHATAEACLKRRESANGTVTPDTRWVSFIVDSEGKLFDLRVEAVRGGEAETACIRAALSARTFPRLRHGGRTWLRLVGTGPRAPADEKPTFAGYVPARAAAPDCVMRELGRVDGLAAHVKGPVRARFTVQQDGSVSEFTLVGPGFDVGLAREVRKAVTACKWIPALDAKGAPASAWVILPIRFAAD